jgi:hypothetical protein
MKKNVGDVDRIIRAVAGFAVLGAGFYFQSWWGALGLVLLGTAAIGWCPPYALLGLNTCSKEQ